MIDPSDISRIEKCSESLRGGLKVLQELISPPNSWPAPDSPAAYESAEALRHGLDDTEMPRAWRLIVDYASVSAKHGEGLASLLDNRHFVSAPGVARSCIEHAQRACWLLAPTHEGQNTMDSRLTARQRAARANLEELYSSRHHRDTLKKLSKDLETESYVHAELISTTIELERLRSHLPVVFGDESKVDGEPATWRIEGQQILGLTTVSEWYFETMALSSGLGVYDLLSAWTHPTIWTIRELQNGVIVDGQDLRAIWASKLSFIENLSAVSCTTLYRMLNQLSTYFGLSDMPAHSWAQQLNEWTPGLIVS